MNYLGYPFNRDKRVKLPPERYGERNDLNTHRGTDGNGKVKVVVSPRSR